MPALYYIIQWTWSIRAVVGGKGEGRPSGLELGVYILTQQWCVRERESDEHKRKNKRKSKSIKVSPQ